MVGALPDAARAGRLGFAKAGDSIALAGPFTPALAASELAKLRGEALPDGLGEIDLAAIRTAQAALRESVRAGEVSSAHDIAEGGLAIALAECCLAGGLGAEIQLEGDEPLSLLFGEGSGGFIVSGSEQSLERLAQGTPVRLLGTVGGDRLSVSTSAAHIELTLAELGRAHAALEELFQ
jgi:phosphoribosylformylglycinamidine synthase